MQNLSLRDISRRETKFKIAINSLLILGFVLPLFCLAQEEATMPKTMEEARTFGFGILGKLPGAIKQVWQEVAFPLLKAVWGKFLGVWNVYIWPKIEPLWQKIKPGVGEEFQKEKQEMQQDIEQKFPGVQQSLWQRFKALLH